jgi:hypothetical protein
MAELPEIMAVFVWDNGMVMVFDKAGQQVPELQGVLAEVGERVAAVFPPERWERGSWNVTHRARNGVPPDDQDPPEKNAAERLAVFTTVAESLRHETLRAARIERYGRTVYFDWGDTYRIEDDGSLTQLPDDPARELERDVFCAVHGRQHRWMGDCSVAAASPPSCAACKTMYFTAAAIVKHLETGCMVR